MLDDLEEVLISSDVGVETTVKIIRRIEERVARDKYMGTSELQSILREEVTVADGGVARLRRSISDSTPKRANLTW